MKKIDVSCIGEKFENNIDFNHLNVIGDSSLLLPEYERLRVGIVGTRKATPAGLRDTCRIAQVLSEAGFIVVSGMALGVDAAAHEGALLSSGKTIAVLGSGVDICYPKTNRKMYEEISSRGCVVSQFENGSAPQTWHFPLRNKTLVSLCSLLIVTEGTLKGGARISVDIALEQGVNVMALPGPRRSYASELCNSVIKDGAGVITDPSDVLNELNIDSEPLGWEIGERKVKPFLSTINSKIMDVLYHQKADTHTIALLTNLSHATIASSLAFLEKNSLIQYQRGHYQVL